MTHTPTRVDVRSVEAFCIDVLEAVGLSPDDAKTVTSALLFADLRGIRSHGIAHLPLYVSMIRRGVNPRGRPRIANDLGAGIVVDGDNALGHVVMTFAMKETLARAARTNVAFAAVGHSNHCGAVSTFAAMALEARMIGVVGTNAVPTMAPFGGTERIVGINPIAVAMPVDEGAPFVLDTSFSPAARARIALHAAEGRPLPRGWALDAEGRPTVDPGDALEGLLAPIGGAKGVGLAMAVGFLSTLLSDAEYGVELGTLEDGAKPGRDGHFCLAVNVAAFTLVEDFERRLRVILDEVRHSDSTTGEALRVAGDRAAAAEAESRAGGVLVAPSMREELDALARELEVLLLKPGEPAPTGAIWD
jgi:LDH2 family malate/lactate/ureidoglycolate dehydrogenase